MKTRIIFLAKSVNFTKFTSVYLCEFSNWLCGLLIRFFFCFLSKEISPLLQKTIQFISVGKLTAFNLKLKFAFWASKCVPRSEVQE